MIVQYYWAYTRRMVWYLGLGLLCCVLPLACGDDEEEEFAPTPVEPDPDPDPDPGYEEPEPIDDTDEVIDPVQQGGPDQFSPSQNGTSYTPGPDQGKGGKYNVPNGGVNQQGGKYQGGKGGKGKGGVVPRLRRVFRGYSFPDKCTEDVAQKLCVQRRFRIRARASGTHFAVLVGKPNEFNVPNYYPTRVVLAKNMVVLTITTPHITEGGDSGRRRGYAFYTQDTPDYHNVVKSGGQVFIGIETSRQKYDLSLVVDRSGGSCAVEATFFDRNYLNAVVARYRGTARCGL